MAIELKLSKSDSATPWGFRLVGGADFGQPIVVVKVNEKSLAEVSGLEVGDIIVRINDTSTAGLTHDEVHDLLLSAGLEFELGIRRGAFTTKIVNGDSNDTEETNILEDCLQREIIDEAIREVNNLKVEDFTHNESDNIHISENLSGQEEIINTPVLQSKADIKKGKKWSTFLIKPDIPIPKPKRKIEEEKVKGEPYRVVIKKQARRPSQEKKVQFNNNVNEVEVDVGSEENEDNSSDSTTENRQLESVEVEIKIVETEETTIVETEANGEYDEYHIEEEEEEEASILVTNNLENDHQHLSEIQIGNAKESASLEEQLRAVQEQLQALSQLPSAIQLTLDAVSKQLASIVGAKENPQSNTIEEVRPPSVIQEEDEPLSEEEGAGEASVSENAEAVGNRHDSDDSSIIEEELEEDIARDEEIEEEGEEGKEGSDPDQNDGLTEEEREAKIRKEELEAKQEKVMDQRTPRPIQRPIILPGGRRWSNPEDAIPNFKKPKMSDEKIIETIESNLEEIFGKRKGRLWIIMLIFLSVCCCGMAFSFGIFRESNCWKVPSKAVAIKHINFLKYQPPPKNLDYLQRSEVYRLVHDMEPPVRGIISRPEKIPAVQDYYEATKGSP